MQYQTHNEGEDVDVLTALHAHLYLHMVGRDPPKVMEMSKRHWHLRLQSHAQTTAIYSLSSKM